MYLEAISGIILVNAGILGAMVGSFLNVCIYRVPKEHLSIVTPRSHCPRCGKMIAWYDNIPIISWLLLGGACRHCRAPISVRYTLVEGLAALLFVLFAHLVLIAPEPDSLFSSLAMSQRWVALAFSYYLIATMVVMTFIDIDYRIIPDGLTYSGVLLAPVFSACFPFLHQDVALIQDPYLSGLVASLFGMLIGGGSLYAIGVFGKMVFKKEAMGLGDVKLMAMVGGFLGWDAALLVFFIGCLVGTVFGIFSMLLTKDHYIPFGPYLAVGTLYVFLEKHRILQFVFEEWPNLMSRWIFPSIY